MLLIKSPGGRVLVRVMEAETLEEISWLPWKSRCPWFRRYTYGKIRRRGL
ncbi:MAG: hypothetical protein IMW96_04115 [Thermoanaerobacteraceae bacterium]|nr:hypothetical protein [Thermoanaerobacteraceae bacterium]